MFVCCLCELHNKSTYPFTQRAVSSSYTQHCVTRPAPSSAESHSVAILASRWKNVRVPMFPRPARHRQPAWLGSGSSLQTGNRGHRTRDFLTGLWMLSCWLTRAREGLCALIRRGLLPLRGPGLLRTPSPDFASWVYRMWRLSVS